MRAPRTRSIVLPATGYQEVLESGDWLEVLDGGTYGYKNRITATLGDVDPMTNDELSLPCVTGLLLRGAFDSISVRAPRAATDTILVRVGVGHPPPPITGKPRVRWLARGAGVVIAPGAASALLDFTADPVDAFDDTRERFELLTWCGWIFCTKTFDVIATARANPETPTGELALQKFPTRAAIALPAGVTGTAGNVCLLDGGTGLCGENPAAPFLPNTSKLWAANTDASNGTFAYLIGVRG